MTDPAFQLRAADAGALVEGTAGHVLTFQSDGRVRGEPPSGGSSLVAATLRATNDDGLVPADPGSALVALTGASFELVTAGPFTHVDGVLTYTGVPTITALVSAVVTLSPTGGLTGWSAAVVSLNGDMIGDAVLDNGPHTVAQVTAGIAVSQQAPGDFGGDERRKAINLSMQRFCSLSTGDTLQVIAANFLNDDSIVVGYSLSVQEVPS